MMDVGVPTVPGSPGIMTDEASALEIAREIGFPVIIKAAAGGGGKGMRVADTEASFAGHFNMAQNEARSAFNDASVYLEKFLVKPRHIEIQIIGDQYGRIVSLGERECSIQRRHQKLIEEAPSPALTPEIRKKMNEAAIRGAESIGYASAGTIEFLFDQDGSFYFMEMNTRIQVEHPVTEMVTGVDLVKEQIRVAAGEHLSIPAKGFGEYRGHAIECRINAEDPARNFAPSPGMIRFFHPAGGPGVRIDSHAYAGYMVPPYYDSLVGKLIVHGNTREEAIVRMRLALESFIIEGIHTTIPFLLEILQTPEFIRGDVDTKFVERRMAERAIAVA
jgi:acetyl-CoA carboxylase biotin carboxylase subunit